MEHIRCWAAGVGAVLGDFVGNMDGLVTILITFVVVDYITGVLCAIVEKRLSSSIGFKGICQKVMIFCLVGIANLLDVNVLDAGSMLRTAVIFFYCANEGISIVENAARIGLPVPEKLTEVMRLMACLAAWQTNRQPGAAAANILRRRQRQDVILDDIVGMEEFRMKKNLHKLFLAFALVLGLVVASSPAADAKDLNLVNRTGEDIIVLNCSPSISDSWFNDVLGNSIWKNGETIIIDFDRWQRSDTWDFKVHYADGASEDWYGVNVRTVNTIILYNNGRNEYQ